MAHNDAVVPKLRSVPGRTCRKPIDFRMPALDTSGDLTVARCPTAAGGDADNSKMSLENDCRRAVEAPLPSKDGRLLADRTVAINEVRSLVNARGLMSNGYKCNARSDERINNRTNFLRNTISEKTLSARFIHTYPCNG